MKALLLKELSSAFWFGVSESAMNYKSTKFEEGMFALRMNTKSLNHKNDHQ